MTPVSLPWPGGSLVGLRPSGLLPPWLHSRAPLLPQPLVEADRPGRPLAHQVDWTLTIGLAKPRAFRDPRYAPAEYASALRLRPRQPPDQSNAPKSQESDAKILWFLVMAGGTSAAPISVWMHGSEFWFARIIASRGGGNIRSYHENLRRSATSKASRLSPSQHSSVESKNHNCLLVSE
jgi:hypothetical protein